MEDQAGKNAVVEKQSMFVLTQRHPRWDAHNFNEQHEIKFHYLSILNGEKMHGKGDKQQ